MADLIRATDWAQTSIGPMAAWPQILRDTIGLCLASALPINIVWGPARAQIYNDAYCALCGDAHPRALGEDYAVTWAGAWPAFRAPFERALAGETSLLENQRLFPTRNGRPEEMFLTVSISPIRDERGKIAGLFHPVTDTTATMLAQRRGQVLRDLAAGLGHAGAPRDLVERAAAVLARSGSDIPFALFYALSGEDTCYDLVAQHGIVPGRAASPARLAVGALHPWPVARAIAERKLVRVDGAARALTGTACGPFPELPDHAFVVPLHGGRTGLPPLIAILGSSARLPLDTAYGGFIDDVAASLAASFATLQERRQDVRRAAKSAVLDRTGTGFLSTTGLEFRAPLNLLLGLLDEMLASAGLTPVQHETLSAARRAGQSLLTLADAPPGGLCLEKGRAVLVAGPTAEAGTGQPLEHASSPTRGRVLLAGAEPDMRAAVQRLLGAEGFEVETVSDGQAALERARRTKPDVIVSDVLLPNLDGLGLLSAVRREPELSGTPVILLGARADGDARLKGLAAGADDYLAGAAAGDLAAAVSASLSRVRTRGNAAPGASEARLRDLLATLDLGTFMTRSFAGTIRFWSAGCAQLYGWSAEEAVGRHSHELLQTRFPVSRTAMEATLRQEGAWTGDLRHRAKDGREIIVAARKVLRLDDEGSEIILEALTDVTETRRMEQDRRRADLLLRGIVATAPGLIYAKDREGRMLIANDPVRALLGKPWSEIIGRTDAEFIDDPAQAEKITATDRRVMDLGQTEEVEELAGLEDGHPRVWLSTKAPLRGPDGEVEGLVGVSVEITERKRSEERLRLMVHELNHRVKNTLATIASIAAQTLRDAPAVFRQTLELRIQALSAAHEVLTRSGWEGAALDDLVDVALAPHGGRGSARFRLGGPPVRLNPRATLALTLGFHELLTNACKYGALSVATGQVALCWSLAEGRFELGWTESGGPAVRIPVRRGFGTKLIERSLAQDLGGTVSLAFEPGGVACTVLTTADEIVAAEAASLPAVGGLR